MIGSRNGIFLWDIEERKVVPSEKPVEIKAWMLTFHFPNVCVVGGSDWDGFKVFNEIEYDGEVYYLEEDSTGKSSSFYVNRGDRIDG